MICRSNAKYLKYKGGRHRVGLFNKRNIYILIPDALLYSADVERYGNAVDNRVSVHEEIFNIRWSSFSQGGD